jgi:hypothetical protein
MSYKVLKIKEWLFQKKHNQKLLDDMFWQVHFKKFNNTNSGRIYEMPKYDPNNVGEDFYLTVRG